MDTPRRFTEPNVIDDDLCSELGTIEDLEFGARFVLVAKQTIFETGGHMIAVKRKIVMPYTTLIPALEMTARFMAQRVRKIAGEHLLRRVK